MTDIAISAQNLSKRYLIGHRSERYVALRDVITREARNFARKAVNFARGQQIIQGDEVEDFWALKDVSFEIKRGEVVGIIGRNGAGKSTLLKILSRITEPTEGCVRIRGRVASLLEVGTGFHPELTGRENIFLNGSVLGMTQHEIRRKFDEIVAFAEVDRFLDTPVKYYSSGMHVRLAFAVAAHLEPEILIVDEVLAVGDAEFQKKSLGKMNDVSRREGRTVLFVSHNMGVISNLCPTVMWLDAGSVRQRGDARAVIGDYLNHGVSRLERIIDLDSTPRQAGGDDRLRLKSFEWLCDLPLQHGEAIKARIQFGTKTNLENVSVGLGFSNADGRRLLTYETDFPEERHFTLREPGIYSCEVEVSSLPLAPDSYYLDIGCRIGGAHVVDYVSALARIEIIAGAKTPAHIIRKDAGVRLGSTWTCEQLS